MPIIRKSPEKILEQIHIEEHESKRGKLKIFFGYAAGVGKTYAMLEAAHEAKKQGIDVVAGYIEPHARPATAALVNGLEVISPLVINHKDITLNEFNLDAAIKRNPQLILVDELAHTNADGCRHIKRYQDIEELLKAGIDVYTTINVQHIESLNDIVASITKIIVRERIPDRIFDEAEQVELVDIEPSDLVTRLSEGKIYQKEQADRALGNFFTVENLTALREIALRRMADRVNKISLKVKNENNKDYYTNEHILVCLSSSPSNSKIIRTAARMANAFKAQFTALFVQTSSFEKTSLENKKRLKENIHLAEQLGAKIEMVVGEDIPFQIAEFARLAGVSKLVIGRSIARNGFMRLMRKSFTDKLIEQTAGLIDCNVGLSIFDFAVFAGHKTLYGPTGISGFVMNPDIQIPTIIFGGTGFESANQDMPNNLPEHFEAGTLNILGIAGLNAALSWIDEKGISTLFKTETEKRKRLIEILEQFWFIKIIGNRESAGYVGIVSCLIDGISSDSASNIFNKFNIAVRTGLHCAPLAHQFMDTYPSGTIRFSVNYFTSDKDFEELEKALEVIEDNM